MYEVLNYAFVMVKEKSWSSFRYVFILTEHVIWNKTAKIRLHSA